MTIQNVYIDEAASKLLFTLEYSEKAPAAFKISVFGHLGETVRDSGPRRNDGIEAELVIDVRRS